MIDLFLDTGNLMLGTVPAYCMTDMKLSIAANTICLRGVTVIQWYLHVAKNTYILAHIDNCAVYDLERYFTYSS